MGFERDVEDFGRLRRIAVGFGGGKAGGKAPETQLAEGAERTASIDDMGDSWRIYGMGDVSEGQGERAGLMAA